MDPATGVPVSGPTWSWDYFFVPQNQSTPEGTGFGTFSPIHLGVLAVLAIGVSLMTSLRERQDEFALSRRAGATPELIHRSTLIETIAVLAIAFALGAGVIAVVWGRLAQNFAATDVGMVPGVPGMLGWFVLTGAVMALIATVGGTSWALRSIRVE